MTSPRARVLLIPGLLCDESMWRHQIDALADVADVIVADVAQFDDLTDMARAALTLVDGPVDLVGHSMGGRVALEVWRQAPERVRSLVLMDTGAHPAGPDEPASRQVLVDISAHHGMRALADAWLPPMLHPDRVDDAALVAPLVEMVMRATPDQHARQIRALLNRPDASALLGTITVPTLVVVGRQDRWSPLSQHEDLAAAIATARLAIVEDAGHMVTVEQPEAVTALLRAWLSGARDAVDYDPAAMSLDPQIQAILDGMAAQPAPAEPPTLEQTRAAVSAMTVELSPPATDMASITEIMVAGPNGDVRCIVDRPTDADGLPVLVYFHGGGCVLLGADGFNPVCTNIAAQAECIVVNVDYRLAPEHPFPAPLDDSFAVYRWCLDHAAEFGGDPTRVAVGGDSAGGYLAAAISLDAKAAGIAQPTLQVLVYPQVDAADRSTSMITVDAFLNEGMIGGLVAAHVGDAVLDPRASPLRAADHSGLAPAFILAAGHDPLVDQGRAYAAILQRAGVATEYRCYDTMIHAFFTFGGAVDVANEAVSDVARALRNAFAA